MTKALHFNIIVISLFGIFLFESCKTSQKISVSNLTDSVMLKCAPHPMVFQWPENGAFVRMKPDSTTSVYPFADEFHMTSLSNLNFSFISVPRVLNIEKEAKQGYFLYHITPPPSFPDSIVYINLQIWYDLPADTLVTYKECSGKSKNDEWRELRQEFPVLNDRVLLYTYTFKREEDGYLYNIGGFRGLERIK